MRPFFLSLFTALLSWWGLWLIAALDSTMVFFLPLAIDIAVIVLASRSPHVFWVYAIIAAAGSLCGAGVTYYVGRRLGERGLERFVSEKRLAKIRQRIDLKGAIPMAVLDLVPPPFPFTAFILAAGSLRVNPYLFFTTLGLVRLFRFGVEALLAYLYGTTIIRWFSLENFQYAAISLAVIALVGSAITAYRLVRNTQAHRRASRARHAA
jgi:membrane protein YqaA with SNARE-associated domain